MPGLWIPWACKPYKLYKENKRAASFRWFFLYGQGLLTKDLKYYILNSSRINYVNFIGGEFLHIGANVVQYCVAGRLSYFEDVMVSMGWYRA